MMWSRSADTRPDWSDLRIESKERPVIFFGASSPAASRNVGATSVVETKSVTVRPPPGMVPGHMIAIGTRAPESYRFPLGPWEGHSVVAGHHDQGVLELAHLFQQVHQLADIAVEALDLEVVVGHIAPHHLGIGEVLKRDAHLQA